MPTVPVYQPRLGVPDLPTVRNNVQVDAGDFGGGVARATAGFGQDAQGAVMDVVQAQKRQRLEAERKQKEADGVSAQFAANAVNRSFAEIETEATNTFGEEAARKAPEFKKRVDEAWKKTRDTLKGRAQVLFDQNVTSDYTRYSSGIDRHANQEYRRFQISTATDTLARHSEEAANGKVPFVEARAKAEAAARIKANATGMNDVPKQMHDWSAVTAKSYALKRAAVLEGLQEQAAAGTISEDAYKSGVAQFEAEMFDPKHPVFGELDTSEREQINGAVAKQRLAYQTQREVERREEERQYVDQRSGEVAMQLVNLGRLGSDVNLPALRDSVESDAALPPKVKAGILASIDGAGTEQTSRAMQRGLTQVRIDLTRGTITPTEARARIWAVADDASIVVDDPVTGEKRKKVQAAPADMNEAMSFIASMEKPETEAQRAVLKDAYDRIDTMGGMVAFDDKGKKAYEAAQELELKEARKRFIAAGMNEKDAAQAAWDAYKDAKEQPKRDARERVEKWILRDLSPQEVRDLQKKNPKEIERMLQGLIFGDSAKAAVKANAGGSR